MPSIVIADDERENLTALKRYLLEKNASWKVFTAETEAEVQEILAREQIDLVITDLVMASDHSGMNIIEAVKRHDPLAMVILITAFEKKLDRYHAFDLGAFDCVQKNVPGVVAAEEILVKGRAAIRFRELALHEIDSQKHVAFLKRYFDPRVFGAIKQDPEILQLKNQNVTIAFWDIRGFSKACESLKTHPELIAGFLKDYCEAASEVIFKNGGVLDKFIGDGVMGLFGALPPDAEADGAVSAVQAAIDLRRKFDDLLPTWSRKWELNTPHAIAVGLGAGIHTGEALVGNVGTEIREQYTALGSSVNLAQRLEARSKSGEILVSGTTFARTRAKYSFEDSGTLTDLKNIHGEFPIYRLIPGTLFAP